MSDAMLYDAFAAQPGGGNPAGIVLDAEGLDSAAMRRIAAEVGASETAFVVGQRGPRDLDVRYYAPQMEVTFCGHATIALAVALAERRGVGPLLFRTLAGDIAIHTTMGDEVRAAFTSVPPTVEATTPGDEDELLAALGWARSDLDPSVPLAISAAGARHAVVAAATRARLADLDYDYARLRAVMQRLDLTTAQLFWREPGGVVHARNPFPVGGVVEDPATGAAAAALAGYLRHLGLVPDEATLTIRQGEDMGRPSLLTVRLFAGAPGVEVSGGAVRAR